MKDDLTNVAEAPAPPEPASRPRGLVFRLYTSNPFYVISADLVFVGLRISFDTSGTTFGTWALMLGLAGYTLLLATTACLLIRYGKVWDDVRSVLLLIVMMFLAMSVTFDDTLAGNPRLGTACFLGGLLFAVAVTEGLLRGIRLSMPAWFRVSYYLLLGLFFIYPVGLSPLLRNPEGAGLQWALFGFSPLAGLLSLSLLPAIRRGPRYVRDNGSPWTWPLYPWVLFGLLGLAVCARSSYLCVSLHFVDRTLSERTNTIFGPYFLVPFLLAVGVLLLEIGIVARRPNVVRIALLLPVGLVALACVGHRPDPVYQRFLGMFASELGGTPLFLTLVASALFYAIAMLRAVPLAYGGLAATLAALSVVGPGTLGIDGLVAPRVLPFLGLGVMESWRAYRQRDSRRALAAGACLVASIAIGLPEGWLPTSRTIVAGHLAIGVALAIGAVFDDEFGRMLQVVSACVLFLASTAAAVGGPRLFSQAPPELVHAYPLVVVVIALGYGAIVGNRLFFVQATATLAAYLSAAGWRGYLLLRQLIEGLDLIAWGLAFFVLAALISIKKAGAWPKRLFLRSSQNEL